MIVAGATVISYLVSAFFGVRKYHTVNYLFMFLGFLIIREKDKADNKKEEFYSSWSIELLNIYYDDKKQLKK